MNPTGGTGVRKSYKPGEIIQDKCTPIFQIVNVLSTERGKVCDSCFQMADPKSHISYVLPCSGCKKMYYCGKPCQIKDWKNGHKLECRSKTWNKTFEHLDALGKDQNHPTFIFVKLRFHLFRALAFLKLNQEIANKPFPMYDGSTRSFNELLALQEVPEICKLEYNSSKSLQEIPDITKLENYSRTLLALCTKFAKEISEENLDTGTIVADRDFFIKLMQIIMSCNAINEKTVEKLSVYIERSAIKHSCKPNAFFCTSPDGKCLQLKAIAPIQEGEKPTMSYVDTKMGKELRQKNIKSLHWFDCTCDRCTTDEDAPVDFVTFESHAAFFQSCTPKNNNWATVSVGEFFTRHEEMVEWMKKMYQEYDEPVTDHYSLVYRALVFTYLELAPDGIMIMDSPKAKALFENTKKHIVITYGKHHPEYEQLIAIRGMVEFNKMMNNPNRPT